MEQLKKQSGKEKLFVWKLPIYLRSFYFTYYRNPQWAHILAVYINVVPTANLKRDYNYNCEVCAHPKKLLF